MKNFEYAAPRNEEQLLSLLSTEPGHTELLAGGTDLVGLMKKMVIQPERVVNLMEVESLRQLGPDEEGNLWIGATVHLDELLSIPYLENYPAIVQAIRGMNSMQLQAQGTIGGDICVRPRCWFFRNGHGLLAQGGKLATEGDNRHHAILGNDGAAKFVSGSRIAPALIALDAYMRIIGPNVDEEQIIPVADFYRIPRHERERETILESGQVVTHFILPPVQQGCNATYEVRHGEGADYPLAAAAASLEFDGRVVRKARVVMGQVAPVPWISEEAEAALVGRPVTPQTADEAGQAAVSRAQPLSHNGYKVQLAKTAVKRAILLAAGLETGGF
jgi:xanthine dehydrogenase YagS FAD-binding subunit